MTKVNLELLKKRDFDFPESLIPDNMQELIDRIYDKDNRKVGRLAKKEEDKGEFSTGLIKAAKKAIQLHNKLEGSSRSAKEARADYILFEYTSDGRKARKF